MPFVDVLYLQILVSNGIQASYISVINSDYSWHYHGIHVRIELWYDWFFIIACTSAFCQVTQNFSSKAALETKLCDPRLIQIYANVVSVVMGCTLITLTPTHSFPFLVNAAIQVSDIPVMLLCGINYFYKMNFAYRAVFAVGRLGYAISDVVRRVVVIISAVLIFGNPITPMNIVGVFIIFFGVGCYNISQSDSQKDHE